MLIDISVTFLEKAASADVQRCGWFGYEILGNERYHGFAVLFLNCGSCRAAAVYRTVRSPTRNSSIQRRSSHNKDNANNVLAPFSEEDEPETLIALLVAN